MILSFPGVWFALPRKCFLFSNCQIVIKELWIGESKVPCQLHLCMNTDSQTPSEVAFVYYQLTENRSVQSKKANMAPPPAPVPLCWHHWHESKARWSRMTQFCVYHARPAEEAVFLGETPASDDEAQAEEMLRAGWMFVHTAIRMSRYLIINFT